MSIASQMHVIPSGAPLGAEIVGVDLSEEIDEETFHAIDAAYNTHTVLVFRHQKPPMVPRVMASSAQIMPWAQRPMLPVARCQGRGGRSSRQWRNHVRLKPVACIGRDQ
jgi:hypothetical protein